MAAFLALAKKWRLRERGFASTALIIIAMPLILGAFGFGFDTLRLAYAKRYLQGRLDVATQAGASIGYTNAQGNIRIGDAGSTQAAIDEALSVYLDNTSGARPAADAQSLVGCTQANVIENVGGCGVSFRVVGTPPRQRTDFCEPSRSETGVYGLGGRATDRVDTIFLRLIGVDSWDLEVQSEALLRYQNC